MIFLLEKQTLMLWLYSLKHVMGIMIIDLLLRYLTQGLAIISPLTLINLLAQILTLEMRELFLEMVRKFL